MSLLARVVALLRESEVAHALIGATALSLHGVSRATDDIDLFTTDRSCLEPEFWLDGLPDEAVQLRRGPAEDPLAGVVRIIDNGEIDVVVGKHRWQLTVTEDAVVTELDDTSLPVATPLALVLLKLYAGGPQDAWDVESLLSLDESGALRTGVDGRIEDLPTDARELWQRILRRA